MHATAIVAALAGIAASASGMGTDPVAAKGMKVDREMADGLYTFAITNGTVLQYAAPPAVSSVHTARHARTVAARGVLPNPDVACTGHDTVQNAMEHAAWQILVNWCQNGGIIPERQGVFAKVGVSVPLFLPFFVELAKMHLKALSVAMPDMLPRPPRPSALITKLTPCRIPFGTPVRMRVANPVTLRRLTRPVVCLVPIVTMPQVGWASMPGKRFMAGRLLISASALEKTSRSSTKPGRGLGRFALVKALEVLSKDNKTSLGRHMYPILDPNTCTVL